MRRIDLRSMVIEHFKSFVTRTTIDFSVRPGLKFLGGANQLEPRLGANGAGKSSLWDALCFCLYGTAARAGRASQLVSHGKKAIYVGVELLIDDAALLIERTSSPNKIRLNGQPVEQLDIDRAVGLSRARFLQAVLFGQAVPLFLDLSVPDRGLLLDEVLDLSLWMKLAELAGKKCAVAKRDLVQADKAVAYEQGREATLESATGLQAAHAAWEAERSERIENLLIEVTTAEDAQKAYATKETVWADALAAFPAPQTQQQVELATLRGQLTAAIAQRNNAIAEAQADTTFFAHTKVCPVCAQTITANFAAAQQAKKQKLLHELQRVQTAANEQLTDLAAQLTVLQTKARQAEQQRADIMLELRDAQHQRIEREHAIARLAQQLEREAAQENPYAAALARLTETRATIKLARRQAEGQQRKARTEVIRYDYWTTGFKRVRLFLIKRVLAHLELEVANAANALGLPGWKIKFTTELETASGTIKPGVHVQVSSPVAEGAWELWSGGEAQRLRIAVAVGLATLIQRMAGISFKFEIWDEPSAWLSAEGIEDLLDCLRRRAELHGKALWLCDHRALTYGGFAEIWQVEKGLSGSTVSLLSKAN